MNEDIRCMCWTQNFIEIDESDKVILDMHKTYLANLTNLNSLSSTVKKQDYNSKFGSKNMLNFLLVCLESGLIKLYIFGVLPCGTIDVKSDLNLAKTDSIKLVNIQLSNNFKHLYVTFEKNGQMELMIYQNDILLTHQIPLWNIAIKYSHILSYLSYIDDTIQCIVEAWEKVLLEMDNKLTKYAKTQPKGSVSADFLELLMFGYPSDQLEQFLTRDLTEKELKKLGNSIELSYSTIQKLVVKPLHTAILNLFYHVNHMVGMQQNTFYYKELLGGIHIRSLVNTGAFLIKSYELQQTIDSCTRDYKIFFRWLYVAIIRLLDETIPEDIATFSPQEITYLAEFLNNFEKNTEETSSETGEVEMKFNLERVGQYLVDKDLVIPLKMDVNGMWEKLLEENECLRKLPHIYPHHRSKSLIQQRNSMKSGISDLFGKLEETVGGKFIVKYLRDLDQVTFDDRQIITSNINLEKDGKYFSYFAILLSESKLLFLECRENQVKTIFITLVDSDAILNKYDGKLSFVDVKFYSSSMLSILAKNTEATRTVSVFFQFPLSHLELLLKTMDGDTLDVSFYSFLDDCSIKVLDGLDAVSMAVSGSRKVAHLFELNFLIFICLIIHRWPHSWIATEKLFVCMKRKLKKMTWMKLKPTAVLKIIRNSSK